MSDTQEKANKAQLILIFAIPVFIVLVSTAVFFTGFGAPSDTKNKGELIHPARALADVDIQFTVDTPHKKPVWTLLHIAPDGCDERCEATLLYSRQIRTSLGRRTPGLRRLLWVEDVASNERRLSVEHADLEYQLLPSDESRNMLLAELDNPMAHQFYLIDPRGFLMMYYTEEQNYKEIIRDLKFLLTQSGY